MIFHTFLSSMLSGTIISLIIRYSRRVVAALNSAVDGCADFILGLFLTFDYFLPESNVSIRVATTHLLYYRMCFEGGTSRIISYLVSVERGARTVI